MKLPTERYTTQQEHLPAKGQQIIAQFDSQSIIVYQAFQDAIADYAVANQSFGGPAYNFQRMTWIKPNFMWMMYRSGWAEKPGQERILAIRLRIDGFKAILNQAVYSSFFPGQYPSREAWQSALSASSVRLQWDPDHGPRGGKLERKAIQLGIRGQTLQQFNKQWIMEIGDITEFVKMQKRNVSGTFEDLMVPVERVFDF